MLRLEICNTCYQQDFIPPSQKKTAHVDEFGRSLMIIIIFPVYPTTIRL